MELTSQAFDHGAAIPRRYTCQGDDVSPPLAVSGVPPGTRSLALMMDDPDAPRGTWDHWVLYDIPADVTSVPEGGAPAGATAGRNSWGRTGWGGPCPPSGRHRYFFRLYALDAEPGLGPGATKQELERAIEGHVLDRAELMGTYQKS